MPEIDIEAIGNGLEEGIKDIALNGWEGALKAVFFALVLLLICTVIRRVFLRILDRGLDRSHVEKTFHGFIHSGANVVLWFLTLMIVAECLGINAASLVTLLGIVGLAVSLSVQDTLANLAGGFTILATQPFKVGDYVKIGTTEGYVQSIGMVYTRLRTYDRRMIVLPNSTVTDGEIVNYFSEAVRRVERRIGVSYQAPTELVKAVLLEAVAKHPLVLRDPPPSVRMSDFGDSAIEYRIWVWCESKDYWTVDDDVMDLVKIALDREGITIPYPQMEVTLRNQD